MPQMPSGLHIAIQAARLVGLLDDVARGERIEELCGVMGKSDLAPFIDVMFFRETESTAQEEVAPGGLPIPVGLESYPSGWTLETFKPSALGWTQADCDAWWDYIQSERALDYFDVLWEQVFYRFAAVYIANDDSDQAPANTQPS